MLFTILGALGAIFFALSGLPQAVRSYRDGHSNGVLHGTIWLWLLGEACMMAYASKRYPEDYVLIGNYILNLVMVLIITKYKYWPRHDKD